MTGNATAATQTLSTTSFGNYEFMAVGADSKPFYGILPLKFNGGYLTMDILIFAPGAFFNLREVFPFYQFDIDKKIIRYRKSEQDNWVEYQPSAMEQLRAKQWFERNPVTTVQQP